MQVPASLVLVAVGLGAVGCRLWSPPSSAEWFEVIATAPGDEVSDPSMRARILASELPWKVRDRATGIEMVLVLPGEFLMGAPESEVGWSEDEGPPHSVRLTRPFYLGRTEVSQREWAALMGPTHSFFAGPELPIDPSWNDVQEFLARANDRSGSSAEPLRLPTEAEWEYACRAGREGPFGFEGAVDHGTVNHSDVNHNDGDVERAVVVDGRLEVEWRRLPSPECRMRTAPVGSLTPNAWGLHEMHGNLWEWCADVYDARAWARRGASTVDPFVGSGASGLRSLRGGSWYDPASECRAAARDAGGPQVRSNRIGFRPARSI